MAEIEFRQALCDGISEMMGSDPEVVLFSEDVALAGGVFQVTRGLHDTYGSSRVFDTPISELALAGAAFGAAVTGLRPIIEVMFGDFMPLVMDSLINQAAKYWFLSQGECTVPLVVRSAVGGGGRFGAIHSQVPAPWLMAVPGLKVVAPATPSDAKALLKSAIRDDSPVIFLEHKRLYSLQGAIDEAVVGLGSAKVVREGADVTIVSAMKGVHDSLEAAQSLSGLGISAEVVDLRTLRPLDFDTVTSSVHKTRRLLVVEEGPLTGGWAAEVMAGCVERLGVNAVDDIWRLTCPDLPLPYSPPLEDAALPSAAKIVESISGRSSNTKLRSQLHEH
jgi:pyruvate/2-oxoglutarate/acetoin dehydrogenase E1 component